jgi:hypothetical protein
MKQHLEKGALLALRVCESLTMHDSLRQNGNTNLTENSVSVFLRAITKPQVRG